MQSQMFIISPSESYLLYAIFSGSWQLLNISNFYVSCDYTAVVVSGKVERS